MSFSIFLPANAATVVGPADAGRIKPEERIPDLNRKQDNKFTIPSEAPMIAAPKGADAISFVLNDIKIEDETAFSENQLSDIYSSYLGKEVTMANVYTMAGRITERYRDAGYFLSLAYIPDQHFSDGKITIKVIEGYVGKVDLPKNMQEHDIVQSYITKLLKQKPISAQTLESFLLRLNDLPGYSVSGTLSPLEGATDGAVKLTLEVVDKAGKGQVSFDNYSSRFLGPHQVAASYTKSLISLQQTTLSGLTSIPNEKLNYGTVNHAIVIAPDLTLDFTGSMTKANPGYTLESSDVESTSTFLGSSLNYQWIRQREENLSLNLSLDSRNTSTDLANTPFTRDRIRAARVGANYDVADKWYGYNFASIKLSQGIDGLGSSEKGDINLSRAQARPDFTKAELSATRLQAISNDWSLLMSSSAQIASGPLYSAEEFGYGGQGFGRAYDSSEITGDDGISASFEIRYAGLKDLEPIHLSPYVFYDAGIVWNDDIAQVKRDSGTSAGLGLRAATEFGLNGNIGLAWPLTRTITPIYGQDDENPRVLLQISQEF